jgi:hypothetical protein
VIAPSQPVAVFEPEPDPITGKWRVCWMDGDKSICVERASSLMEAHIIYALKAEHLAGRLLGVVP